MKNIYDDRVEPFRAALKPLYKTLIENVSGFQYSKAFFCMQWGKDFPREKKTGIMFVGRATNGWVNDEDDIEVLFGDTNDAIFNRKDQMQWVENAAGPDEEYNTNRSAFWRVIKGVSKHFYPTKCLDHVVWSNVCKVAPSDGGNPSDPLYYAQLEDCKKILEKEIELLSPKFVVFLTGQGWSVDFIRYLNGEKSTKSVETVQWDRYECKVYDIDGLICIRSEHPQVKDETSHIQCLVDLINKYK